ncbi:GIY-YIG nuclease family protein [Rhizobium laguerreae]|uniref:Bacteriophage T5 Orf172 DNA-binding domain-containing protein n=1 Tax=Rhizobium laguerreae TaxID=1076926 RepID=A0A7Y2RBM7_9HYPH|nr:GIY-YIG nuclease family protein [Rhizobium laguerreae]NNH67813.1 hypothetical protein [Rhizobium laguerreae]
MKALTVKQATARIAKRYGKTQEALVSSFIPAGRTAFYIYAIVVKDHLDKVKIGMTKKWSSRRFSYANWNLAQGDGILDERVFIITDEFIDLGKIEAFILATFGAERAFGNEWFNASLDDAARHIDRVFCETNISYVLA